MNNAATTGLITVCGLLIIAIMVINPVILLFSGKEKYKILGIIGCFFYLITALLFVTEIYVGAMIVGVMTFPLFYGTCIYMVATGNKTYKKMGVAWMLLSTSLVLVSVITAQASRASYHRKMDCCITVLKNLEDAQNKYHAVNNKYAPDLKELSKYTEYLCRKGDKAFCGLTEANKFRGACYNVDLTIENGKSNIEGRFEDTCDLGCLLRITSKGVDK